MPAAFTAAAARIFIDLSLDSGPVHNGVWIAALVAVLPAIPYLLCLDAVSGGCLQKTWIRRLLALLFLPMALLDAAQVLSVIVRTSGCLTLDYVPAFWLALPMALVILWCVWRNGDAIGYAAILWSKVFPALMLLVVLLQARHYRPEWLMPLLGNGWRDIVTGGVRASGCLAASTAVLLAADGSGKAQTRGYSFGWLAFAPAIAALLLALRLMMAPTGVGAMPWTARLDALLTNGRAPLYLQLPMILTFFTGLLHLLACDGFAASALLQGLVPALDGRLCGAVVAVASLALSLQDLTGSGVTLWLFFVAAPGVALAALFQSALVRGDRRCEG